MVLRQKNNPIRAKINWLELILMMVALLLVSMTSDYSNSCSKVKVVEASQVPILSKLMMMLTTIATMTIQPTKRIVAAEN